MRTLLYLVTIPGIVLGAAGTIAAVLAFIDPVGVESANDADPFGSPPDRASSAYALSFWGAVLAFSLRRPRWMRREQHDESGGEARR